jgi:hypothetical protein
MPCPGNVTACTALLSTIALGVSVAGDEGCLHAPNISADTVSANTLKRISLFLFMKLSLFYGGSSI